MAWTKGFNFRSTAIYVTDGTNDTYVLDDGSSNGEQYPTTRNSVTFGYTATTFNVAARNRNSGNNAKLAGMHFLVVSELTPNVFRVDLPATGQYKVRIALGEASYARTGMKVIIRDNGGAALLTVAGDTTLANQFLDAAGTERTAADWVTNNAQSAALTFASTIAEVVLGNGATGPSSLAHVEFDQVTVAATPTVLRELTLLGVG